MRDLITGKEIEQCEVEVEVPEPLGGSLKLRCARPKGHRDGAHIPRYRHHVGGLLGEALNFCTGCQTASADGPEEMLLPCWCHYERQRAYDERKETP